MALNLPALKGSFGSTEYFICSMKVGEFTRSVVIPKEMDGWEELTAEERFQRDINYTRVKQHIAPYLAHDPDRFIGSFIICVKNDEDMAFESLEDSGIKIPKMMGTIGSSLGVLIFSGKELLVPLDGQHRLAALKFAISGKDQKDMEIKGLTSNSHLSEEDVTLILIRDDPIKSRKIFNKVNRYAKPTSKADNLITADDDIVAIANREIVINDIIGSRIVKMDSGNTLTSKSKEFTTIATTYEICVAVIEDLIGSKVNTQSLPSIHDQQVYKNAVQAFWNSFLKISAYENSLLNVGEDGDANRADIRNAQIHCKPIVMRAIADAIMKLRNVDEDQETLSVEECVERIDTLDWSYDNDVWQGTLLNGDKIISGTTPMKFASRFISYLLGEKLTDFEINDLKKKYRLATGGSTKGDGSVSGGKELPDPIFQ